jgi:hypothetical protein
VTEPPRRRARQSVSDWRRAVYASRRLPDSVRVLLLLLADHMGADRRVSIPRTDLAAMLGISERRVTQRVTEAHTHGFLTTIVRGQKGVTAIYQGLFGEAFRGTATSPLKGDALQPPDGPFSGTPVGPTTTGDSTTPAVARTDRHPADQPGTATTSPRRQRLSPVPSATAGPVPDLSPETVDRSEVTTREAARPCDVCGIPLWPTLAAAGHTAHRSCEPATAARSTP